MNRRTRARVQRLLGISAVKGTGRDDARDRTDDERISQVFVLKLQIISALLVGGWAVYADRLAIGGVVAFISGIGRITGPWGDLVDYYREANITQVKYGLVRDAINQRMEGNSPAKT